MYGPNFYFNGAVENRELTLKNMTEGIDIKGMENLLEDLKLNLLEKVKDELRETDGIVNAFNKGWQGQARDMFFTNFEKAIGEVKDGLEAEYKDLVRKFGELTDNYYREDQKMIDLVK